MTRLPPSSIHFMDASKEPGLLSPCTRCDVIEAFSRKSDHLKVQVVEKDGLLYTLNNSTLDLCRNLEERGYLAKVKVDIIRCSNVPTPLLNLMNPPKESAPKLKQCVNVTSKGYQRLPKDEIELEENENEADDEFSNYDDEDEDDNDDDDGDEDDEEDDDDTDDDDGNEEEDYIFDDEDEEAEIYEDEYEDGEIEDGESRDVDKDDMSDSQATYSEFDSTDCEERASSEEERGNETDSLL